MVDFQGSFKDLAEQLGADVVGEPVGDLFYNDRRDEFGNVELPGNVATQYSTKGKFEAVKVDEVWQPPYFFVSG